MVAITKKQILRMIIFALLAVMAGLIGYKVFVVGYTFADLIPQTSYSVELAMNFTGNGEDVVVRTFLPATENSQKISDELVNAPGLEFRRETTPIFVRGQWGQYQAAGPYQILYSFNAQLREIRYDIPSDLRIPDKFNDGLEQYLQATDAIQLNHPVIEDLSDRLLPADRRVLPTLQSIYDYVLSLGSKPFKGTTDAVTAAKLGEASCNGKSRLFIALARRAGIPSRLVGGLILNSGSKRTSHQWIEAYVGGHWVPFDALNGHFAVLPDHYLALYRGDEALFVHSRNIGFDYRFNIRKRTIANDRMAGFLGGHAFNLYRTLQAFKRVNISLNILQFLLVIPLGVLIVVISRNVVGIHTFGTFLPALMAMAVRETGLVAGVIAFLIILAITFVIRLPLEKLGTLHTPKLAIMMIVVVLTLLSLTIVSDLLRIDQLSSIGAASLFPIAILTITTERFALTLSEEGVRRSLVILAQTLIVMSFCYLMMSSLAIQALILAFPELLLGVLAMNLWLGSWTGLRVTEMVRFRSLYGPESEGEKNA
jgi:transglutaminase-like putative cysteine protease